MFPFSIAGRSHDTKTEVELLLMAETWRGADGAEITKNEFLMKANYIFEIEY